MSDDQDDLFRLIFESSPMGVLLVDHEGRITLANPQAERLFGYRLRELVGESVEVLVPERLRALHGSDRSGYMASPTTRSMGARRELYGRRKDGTEFPVEIGLTPVPGRPLIAARVVDISERRRLEAALAASEHRTDFALAAARAGTWDVDSGSGAVTWSTSMEHVFGIPLGRFPRTEAEFFELVHEGDRQLFRRAVGEAVARCGDVRMDSRIPWPDESVHWIATAAHAFCDGAGRPVRLFGVAMDITDRKRLEEQYLQAQKLESVGRLAGGIAHDFNNLLTILLGNADLTRQTLGPGHAADPYLLEMLDAAERASALTRQLLAFSRRQVLDPRVIDLNSLLQESADFLHRLLGEDIDLAVRTAPAATLVRVDPGSVSQVVLNLAVNARDAMPQGGRLVIETDGIDLDAAYASDHFGVTPGAYVRLTVSDTGIGMTPEVRAHVFEPFFTTKEEGKGTGLGLSVVHGIVKDCGGRVEVYSEPGMGTTFKIYLPAVEVEPAGPPAAEVPAPGRGAETVLLVEDDAGVRRLAERILTQHGYRVLSAANGEEALQLADARPGEVELVLTDLVMPGMNGRELAQVLRRRLPAVRVLFTSGYTSDAMLRAGVLESEEAFLTKPYTPPLLLRKVREVLDRPRRAGGTEGG